MPADYLDNDTCAHALLAFVYHHGRRGLVGLLHLQANRKCDPISHMQANSKNMMRERKLARTSGSSARMSEMDVDVPSNILLRRRLSAHKRRVVNTASFSPRTKEKVTRKTGTHLDLHVHSG